MCLSSSYFFTASWWNFQLDRSWSNFTLNRFSFAVSWAISTAERLFVCMSSEVVGTSMVSARMTLRSDQSADGSLSLVLSASSLSNDLQRGHIYDIQ